MNQTPSFIEQHALVREHLFVNASLWIENLTYGPKHKYYL